MTMSIEKPTDYLKQLSEWALAAGRFYQSDQTGYVHLYEGEAEAKAQTIPVFENACFILALLRSRLVEQMQEAKTLLKGLIAFQNTSQNPEKGNFPVYLNEYPNCRNSTLGLQLLAPFYWILTQFGHILGSELKHQLENGIRLILDYCGKAYASKPYTYSMNVRLFSAQRVYGSLWKEPSLLESGTQGLENLAQEQLKGWSHTRHLSDLLIGLQMVYPSLSQSPWYSLWERMKETWHTNLAAYIGPCVREWQEREEPRVNVYDLYGGYFSENFSRRASLLGPHHLHGILIQPSLDKFDSNSYEKRISGTLNEQRWHLTCYPEWAFTLLEKKQGYPLATEKMHTPLRIVWGDRHRLHTFVCQGGNIEKVEFVEKEGSLILLFELKESELEGNKGSKKEIELFADFHSEFQFHLNGLSTNTFEFEQSIQLTLGKKLIFLKFDKVEGQGDFLGHIMRGNRPSQLDLKGEKRFQSFDWTFFLRKIRGNGPCKIQLTLSIEDLIEK